MSLGIENFLENYYQGRNADLDSALYIQNLSPALENVMYLLGIADSYIDRNVLSREPEDFIHGLEFYCYAFNLSKQIGLKNLESQISLRIEKQLVRKLRILDKEADEAIL